MAPNSSPWSSRDPAAVLQALELHEAELQAQNLELQATVAQLTQANVAMVVARTAFRLLYDGAPIAYVTIDRGRTIVDLNDAAIALFGAPRSRLLGGTLDLFIAETDRAELRAFIDEVFASGHARSGDLGVLHAGGAQTDCLIDGVAARSGADEVTRCVLAFIDISARKLAESARREAQDEVLAVVSHDLRGPLNAIGLACDALSSGLDPDEARECVGAIERAAARCERLIKDLLGVAHIESGQLTLELAPLDVGELARAVCRDYASAAAAVASSLTCEVGPGSVTIEGDHARLHQVLSNLLGNALVHARGTAIEVRVESKDGGVVVAVSDRGPGIALAEQPMMFDRYRQGRRTHGGAGLGLAIVKGLVVAHHGTVRVHSEPGHGARFEVMLPRGRVPA
jgi:PAS domain S-box-containing protein